ncbi:MAG: hypothetical protein ACRCSN_21165 [Dermatophilaceae bacterium]
MTFEEGEVALWRDGLEVTRVKLGDVAGLEVVPSPRAKGVPVESVRAEYPNAYRAWSDEDDARLLKLAGDGWSTEQLVAEFGRQPSGVQSRLRKLQGE